MHTYIISLNSFIISLCTDLSFNSADMRLFCCRRYKETGGLYQPECRCKLLCVPLENDQSYACILGSCFCYTATSPYEGTCKITGIQLRISRKASIHARK